jgi:DNA repair exonuclease SbcCD nuclease subunit
MLISIVGDTHFGLRNDSAVFNDLARKFYSEVFFPYLEHRGIGTVIQLGDLFDRRKYVNFNTLATAKEYFFNELDKRGITLYALLGNHDIFYRNTLKVNSPSLVLSEYSNVHLIDKPSTIVIGGMRGMPIDLIPWICEENEKEIAEFIKNTKSDFCCGHFELAGFEMDRGNICHEGMDMTTLSKYEKVISGHFHHRSEKGNILYTGVPFQMTWADWNDPKGFHVFDTETRELTFITNPHEIYVKFDYNDDDLYFDDIQNADYSKFTGKYVKVVVTKKNNSFLFETLIENLTKANPHDVTIVEDFSDVSLIESNEEVNQADDTLSIIDKVVEGLEIDLQKPRLKSIMREIYNEALASES